MAAPENDWYLQDWFRTLEKTQNDLTTKLDIHKNTAHRLWHGKQPYRRDYVNQIAAWLNIQPYELLMHPEDAMAIREIRRMAPRVVAARPEPQVAEAPAAKPARRRA